MKSVLMYEPQSDYNSVLNMQVSQATGSPGPEYITLPNIGHARWANELTGDSQNSWSNGSTPHHVANV